MIKLLGWAATILVVGVLGWQLAIAAPVVPRLVSIALLVLISGLTGIRVGTGGASAYIDDVQRVNRVLADQHRELEELNAVLLKQIAAEAELPAPSERV